MELNEVYKPIKNELKKVEAGLIREGGSGREFIASISKYAFNIPGKRLRPALALFSAKVGQVKVKQAAIDVAVVMELIHTATLIQDDVIDKAAIRRGEKTVGTVFGKSMSILFGDYLFSKSFSLLAKQRRPELIYLLSRVTNTMAEGEMAQLFFAEKPVSEERYFEIIENKTARLFSISCEMGAIAGGLHEKQVKALANFGLNFGLAYQIIDDCLDNTPKTLADIYQSTDKAKAKAEQYMTLALKSLRGSIHTTKQLPFVKFCNFVLSYIKAT